MNVLIRIIIVLAIFSVAAWLLFSLSAGINEPASEKNAREELKPIKHGKLKENYTKKEPTQAEKVTKEEEPPELKKEEKVYAKIQKKEVNSNIKKGELTFSTKEWKLLGGFKNVLLVNVSAENGLKENIINKDIVFICTTSNDTVLKKTKRVSVNSNSVISFGMIMGHVDPNTVKVECIFQDKTSTSKINKEISKNHKSLDIKNTKETEKEEDSFPLPSF